MATIRVILGYSLAVLGVPMVLATFIGMDTWAKAFVSVTGLKVSPLFTGDDTAFTVSREGYETRVHRPVFMGLLCDRREGFIQIDFGPLDAVPATLDEPVDYDRDGTTDFRIQLDTRTAAANLTELTPAVLGLGGTYRLKDAWAVRVNLKNIAREGNPATTAPRE